MNDHEKEQERIKNQSIAEWISEYSGEPVKEEEIENGETEKNYGVDF